MDEEYSHSQYYYRHRGRVSQYRDLVAKAGTDKTARREASRAASQARALKHYQLLHALERENELEKQRCQLCDIVRAEAFGLGHDKWLTRQCSQCFSASSERSARLRHMRLPMQPELVDEVHRDALLFRIVSMEQRLSLLGEDSEHIFSTVSEPQHACRSARVAAVAPPVLSLIRMGAVDGASSSGVAQEILVGGEESVVDEFESPTAEKPSHQNEQVIPVDEVSRSGDSDKGGRSDNKQHRSSDILGRGALSQPEMSPSDQDCSFEERVEVLMQSLRKGDRRNVLEGLLSLKDFEDLIAKVLLQGPSIGGEGPADIDSRNESLSEVVPKTAFEKVREDLRQAEQDIAFAPTQELRSRALHLAFDLRRNLAELNSLQRKEKKAKAMQQYKDRVVVPRPLGAAVPISQQSMSPPVPRPLVNEGFDTRWDIKHVVANNGLHGPVSTGLMLATQSKAKRTARALATIETMAATGSRPGPKGHLRHGISATRAGLVHTQLLAAAAQRRSPVGRQAIAQEGLQSEDQARDDWDGGGKGSVKVVKPRMGPRATVRSSAVGPTHPSKLDPDHAVDQVNWRPSTSRTSAQHLPGFGSAGDWDGLDPMAELAKLRHMRVDDWRTQRQKEREWQKALEEVKVSQKIQ